MFTLSVDVCRRTNVTRFIKFQGFHVIYLCHRRRTRRQMNRSDEESGLLTCQYFGVSSLHRQVILCQQSFLCGAIWWQNDLWTGAIMVLMFSTSINPGCPPFYTKLSGYTNIRRISKDLSGTCIVTHTKSTYVLSTWSYEILCVLTYY